MTETQMASPHKTCVKCGEAKPLEEFHKNKASADGLTARCRECRKRGKTTRHRLLEKDLESKTGICSVCGPVILARKSATQVQCHNARREQRADRGDHGLTQEEARKFVQGKVCAICGTGDRLMVDHCHETGKIREPLCLFCNFGIGHFRDQPDLLEKAAAYLRLHKIPD